MTKRIFTLNQYIKAQLETNGELDTYDLDSINTWGKEINGLEVTKLSDNVYSCGIYLIDKSWTIEVEC